MRLRVHTNLMAVALALVIGACGDEGNPDEQAIRTVVEDAFTKSTKGKCTKLATQRFLEQSELSKGKEAVNDCEQDADEISAESVDIEEVRVSGARASARFTLDPGESGFREATVRLRKSGDAWKLDRLAAVDIDREAFFKDAEKDLSEGDDGIPRAAADCVIKGYKAYSDSEIEQAIVKPDVARLVGPVFPCTAPNELKGSISPAAVKCVSRGLDRGQRSGRLRELLGQGTTFEELDIKAFQRELRRLVTICAKRDPGDSGDSGSSSEPI